MNRGTLALAEAQWSFAVLHIRLFAALLGNNRAI